MITQPELSGKPGQAPSGEASAWQAQEFRHLGAQLGLTPAGMASLGWVVVHREQ